MDVGGSVDKVFHRGHLIGRSLALRFQSTLALRVVWRGCRLGSHCVRRWCRLPGRSYPWSRVGISLALGFVSMFSFDAFLLHSSAPSYFEPGEVIPPPSLRLEWNEAITEVRDTLPLLSRRGGQINASSFVLKSRKSRIPKEDRVAL